MATDDQYIQVAGVLEVLDTGDRPIKAIGEDDNAYLIKHNILGHHLSNLIREWICYQLYKRLGVSIPKSVLLNFEPSNFYDELRPLTGRFYDHIVFGSEWMESREPKDELYESMTPKAESLLNPAELASILVMDLWLKNNDRVPNNLNLIVSQRKLYAIDHAATFDQEPFERLADPVRKEYFVDPGEIGGLLVNTHYFKYYFAQYALEFEQKGLTLCNKIEQIDATLVEQILESVPSNWNLDLNERQAITEYLIYRQDKLKDRFLGHLNFSRQQ